MSVRGGLRLRIAATALVSGWAWILTGCTSLVAPQTVSDDGLREVSSIARLADVPPAAAEATSEAGREFRMLRYRNELGEIPDDAMSRAIGERLMLIKPQEKRGGVSRYGWAALGPSNLFGGRVNALYVDPTNPQHLLAGAATGGIWQTMDAGGHWTQVDDFLASLAISSFAGDAGNAATIYAATSEYYYTGTQGVGVLKSTDGGHSWQLLPATDPANSSNWTYVMRLAAHPTAPGVLLAGTWTGAMRTTDGGITWTKVFSQTAFDGHATIVLDIRFNPSNPNQVLLGLEDSAVAYSNDAGVTWNKVQIAPPVNQRGTGRVELAFAASSPGLVYASVNRNGGEVWGSNDAGHTWTLLSLPEHLIDASNSKNAIWVDPTNAQRVVIGGTDLWRSTNGGLSFEPISDWRLWPASAHADQHVIAADPGFDGVNVSRVYVASDGGVYRADNIAAASPAAGWTNLNNGLNAVQFWGAAASPAAGGLFVGGTQDHGTLVFQRSTSNWFRWFDGDGGSSWIDPNDALTFYGEYTHAAVFHTIDGGATRNRFYICAGIADAYQATPTLSPCGPGTTGAANFIAPTVLDPNQSSRLWVGAKSLWVTDDARVAAPQWRAVKLPSTGTTASGAGNWISAIAVQPGNSSIVWVGHNNGELYFSTNALAPSPTWTPVSGLPARFVTRISFVAGYGRLYIAHGGFASGNLHVSYDGGSFWYDISGALPAAPIYALAVGRQNPNVLYVGTQVGLFTSEEGGVTWSSSNDGPANVPVEELSWLDDVTLIAATHGRGAFLSSTVTAPIIEFYNAGLDHYFISINPQEISDLDSGVHQGWMRTGLSFRGYQGAAAGASPVCRFYIPPGYGDSHFFSASAQECNDTQVKFPQLEFESAEAFFIALPNTTTGVCPIGTIPVYRLWNHRADSNHRYTTDPAVKAQMIAKGYVAEGYGPDAVAMCALP